MNTLIKNVTFRAVEAQIERERALIAVSAEKSDLARKNTLNRMKQDAKYCKASAEALQLIVEVSSVDTLESLLNYKCAYTQRNILQLAEFLAVGKSCANARMIERMMRENANKTLSVSALSEKMNSDFARDSKLIKTMKFFHLIVSNVSNDFRDNLKKDELITFI